MNRHFGHSKAIAYHARSINLNTASLDIEVLIGRSTNLFRSSSSCDVIVGQVRLNRMD